MLLITTRHRGVFAGHPVPTPEGHWSQPFAQLRDARMAVYWSPAMRGVLGLATVGPDADCRISRAVPGVTTLTDVTMVAEITPEAAARWEEEPWAG